MNTQTHTSYTDAHLEAQIMPEIEMAPGLTITKPYQFAI
jgi:hypothetical protein